MHTSSIKIKQMHYTIQTERLGLRNWKDSDLKAMTALNKDPKVMQYFPSMPDEAATLAYIKRMQAQFAKTQYCYFAAEILATQEFIGFIGLMYQDYEAEFTPCVDIGWRLKQTAWGKGYATEGAKTCLGYAFNNLKIDTIYSVAPLVNTPSISVMKKIGMSLSSTFKHPKLGNFPVLETCALYLIHKPQ